jgi:hypothetical protein
MLLASFIHRRQSKHSVKTFTRTLSAAGMLKLDDAKLVVRAKLVSRILVRVDEPTCARFATGGLAADDFGQMLGLLPSDEQAAWFSVAKSALEAEVTGKTTAPQPSADQIATATSSLSSELNGADQARFNSNLASILNISPGEACWTIRSLYSLVEKASGETQAVAARALVMP